MDATVSAVLVQNCPRGRTRQTSRLSDDSDEAVEVAAFPVSALLLFFACSLYPTSDFRRFLRGPAFSAPHRQTRSRRLLPLFTCAQIIDTKYSCSQIDILHRGGIIPATCVYIICAVCWTNVLFPLPRPSVQGKRFIGGASLWHSAAATAHATKTASRHFSPAPSWWRAVVASDSITSAKKRQPCFFFLRLRVTCTPWKHFAVVLTYLRWQLQRRLQSTQVPLPAFGVSY